MIIVDTGAIIAMLDRSERNHKNVLEYLGRNLVLPVTLLAEIDYMASTQLGSHIARDFFKGLERGDLQLLEFDKLDLLHANEIMERYPNVPLGLADASVIALAERHSINDILTLDRRHFTLVKPRAKPYFNLLPEIVL